MRVLILLCLISCVLAYPKIRIGRTISQLGVYAPEAIGLKNGIDFATKFINNQTGVIINGTRYDLELVTWNDASDPDLVERLYDTMAEKDNVVAFFGPWSTQLVTRALISANRTGYPIVFTAAANTLYTSGYKNSFGMFVQASKRSLTCMNLFGSFGVKTAAIIATTDAFQQVSFNIIVGQLKKLNITLLYNSTVSKTATEFGVIPKDLSRVKPELLILCMEIVTASPFIEQVRNYKWNPNGIFVTSAETLRLIYQQVGWPIDGGFAGNQWDSSLPYKDQYFGTPLEFSQLYQSNFNYTPSFIDAGAVAAVFVLVDALERSVSFDKLDIIQALAETSINETFFGPVSFLPSGEINLSALCQQLQPLNGVDDKRETIIISPSNLVNGIVVYPAIPNRPPPPPPLSSREKLALGLGLGLGIPAVLMVIIMVVVLTKTYHCLFLSKSGIKTSEGYW